MGKYSDHGGGSLTFLDKHGKEQESIQPVAGSVVVFTSGWENIHKVEKLEVLPNGSDVRLALPCFLETRDPKGLERKTLDDFMKFTVFCVAPATEEYFNECLEDLNGWL